MDTLNRFLGNFDENVKKILFFLFSLLALQQNIKRLSHYSGFNPFSPTWKFDRFRMLHVASIFIGFSATFYSMYTAESGIELVKRSMGLGIFSQSILKCFLLIVGAAIYQDLNGQIEMLYRSKDKKVQEVMTNKIDLCEKIYKVITVVNSSAVAIFLGYPLLKLALSGEFIMMFPYYLPYLDPETYFGFAFHYLTHSVLILHTLLFHNGFDIAFVCFTVHAVAIVDLIKIDYEELSELINESKLENTLDMKCIRLKMKDIIEAQRKFDSYVNKLTNLYKWPCFVTSSTSIFSICIALVMILIVKWPLAYGLCWALFGQLLAAYMNGEIINYQVNHFPFIKLICR